MSCFLLQRLHVSFILITTTLCTWLLFVIMSWSSSEPCWSFRPIHIATFSCNNCQALSWLVWNGCNCIEVKSGIFQKRCQRAVVSVTCISIMTGIFLTIVVWSFSFVKSRNLSPMALYLLKVYPSSCRSRIKRSCIQAFVYHHLLCCHLCRL